MIGVIPCEMMFWRSVADLTDLLPRGEAWQPGTVNRFAADLVPGGSQRAYLGPGQFAGCSHSAAIDIEGRMHAGGLQGMLEPEVILAGEIIIEVE